MLNRCHLSAARDRLRHWRVAVATTLLLASMSLRAECAPADECIGIGEWNFSVALGFGARSNPVVNGKNIPLVVIPQISYYGKRFFLDNLEVGFTLLDHPVHQVNLLATPGYDRAFFVRHDLQNYFTGNVASSGASNGVNSGAPGTPVGSPQSPTLNASDSSATQSPRRVTYLAGVEWTAHSDRFDSQLNVLQEVTGRHHGQEVRLAFATPLMQGNHNHQLDLTASAGATWKSAALVDYYYGVPNQYTAQATLNTFIKLKLSKPISEHWSTVSFVHWEHLGRGIANSPLVEKSAVLTGFAGVMYAF
jgi:MipA family protein